MNAPVIGLKAPLARPLYVDLDRTLIAADVSMETWLTFAKRGIGPALLLCWWLLRGRAYAKSMVARRVSLNPAMLPYREEVLEIVRTARAEGRRVVLASGSHQRHVARIARHLGLFDAAVGTLGRRNLKGRTKLLWIDGDAEGAFDYVGDSRADRPIWSAAYEGLTVGHNPRQANVRILPCRRVPLWRAALRAMRPHQWAKNALIGVPLATSGLWAEPSAILRTGLAFVLFSLTASGVYLINDLLDIEADRAHRVKFSRPIASGALPIPMALGLGLVLLTLPLLIAALTLDLAFAAVLGTYLVVTTAYSLRLKQAMTLDVIVLACLYTIRIFAGGVAVGVPVSSWLLTFAVFFFLSLAYLKRYTELAGATQAPDRLLSGRGYVGSDIAIVMTSGVASGMVSILVLALFIKSASPAYQHGTPELLWGLCLVLLYWLNRIWMMARRGQVSGDPIAFAITDRRSLVLGGIALAIALAAQRLSLHF
ncbi:UbiA family prenyltransferase [Sphingomonas sp. ERG5]|uniref:UbiA family prenyltransferase n=1 Tax=Sphingomonas sp. ERG5 TaxID=1381597 RepID=UPI00054B0C7A|nr:UbiA family prenyltransferase [Sphingomonas sp. ERG5]